MGLLTSSTVMQKGQAAPIGLKATNHHHNKYLSAFIITDTILLTRKYTHFLNTVFHSLLRWSEVSANCKRSATWSFMRKGYLGPIIQRLKVGNMTTWIEGVGGRDVLANVKGWLHSHTHSHNTSILHNNKVELSLSLKKETQRENDLPWSRWGTFWACWAVRPIHVVLERGHTSCKCMADRWRAW